MTRTEEDMTDNDYVHLNLIWQNLRERKPVVVTGGFPDTRMPRHSGHETMHYADSFGWGIAEDYDCYNFRKAQRVVERQIRQLERRLGRR